MLAHADELIEQVGEFLNGGPLDDKPARTIEMPARLTQEEFADWVVKRPRLTPDSMKSGSDLLRRVRGLQPFLPQREA